MIPRTMDTRNSQSEQNTLSKINGNTEGYIFAQYWTLTEYGWWSSSLSVVFYGAIAPWTSDPVENVLISHIDPERNLRYSDIWISSLHNPTCNLNQKHALRDLSWVSEISEELPAIGQIFPTASIERPTAWCQIGPQSWNCAYLQIFSLPGREDWVVGVEPIRGMKH